MKNLNELKSEVNEEQNGGNEAFIETKVENDALPVSPVSVASVSPATPPSPMFKFIPPPPPPTPTSNSPNLKIDKSECFCSKNFGAFPVTTPRVAPFILNVESQFLWTNTITADGKILLVGYPRNDTKDLATPPSVNAAHHIRNAHNENVNPDCLAFNNNDSGQGASSSDASSSSKIRTNPFFKRT